MLDKVKQLYQMQKQAKAVQKELADTEIEASSANGEVVVVFTGDQKLTSISIDDNMLDPARKHDLEKTILQVVSEAGSKAQAIAAEKTQSIMKDMGINLPGM